MNNFKIIDCTNVYKEINSLQYGSTNFRYASSAARDWTLEAFKVINFVLNGEYVREVPAVDTIIDGGQYIEIPIKDTYTVIWAWRGGSPSFTKEEYRLEEAAQTAKLEKTKVSTVLSREVHKLAQKTAYRMGIRFGINKDGCFFDGSEKQKPVFRRMEEAYGNGDSFISFGKYEVNMPTIRCYASNLGAAVGEKFSCSIESGKIVVRFKPLSLEDRLKNETHKLFSSIASEIGLTDTIKLFRQVANEKEWDTVVVSDKSDIEIEKELDDFVSGKPSGLESWPTNRLDEPISKTVSGDFTDFIRNEVNNTKSGEISLEDTCTEIPGSHLVEDEDFEPDEFGGYYKTIDGERIYIDPAEPIVDQKTTDFSGTDSGSEDPVRMVDGFKQYYMPELEENPVQAAKNEWLDDFEDADF